MNLLYTFTLRLCRHFFAGSTSLELGSSVLAHKITDNNTNRSWYPYVSLLKNTLQAPLITHDTPQINYPLNGMIDMEGSAFFQSASSFVFQEHVQVLKIISDCDQATQQALNEGKVKDLIHAQLAKIQQSAAYLLDLSAEACRLTAEPKQLISFATRWHCSHAHTLQLKELLRRWNRLFKEDPFAYCRTEQTIANVITKLTHKINHHDCLY